MKIKCLLASMAVLLASCADTAELEQGLISNDVAEEVSSHSVSLSDVRTLVSAQNRTTRGMTAKEGTITCIEGKDHDTLLYVYDNPEGGWTMFSSDTRVPAIVAESESGSYDDIIQNESVKAWILTIAKDIEIIKSLEDDKLSFSPQEIENNKLFWKSISSPDEFVKERQKQKGTRAVGGGDPPPLAIGHYELVSSETYQEVDSISRLTITDWEQGYPYNAYCPLKTNNIDHAPAGCAAIAGAQMLFFLHGRFGVPETAPSSAWCNGNVTNYSWAQTDYTSEIWDEMNTNGLAAAPLIANVGRLLNMTYTNTSSGASADAMAYNVFPQYGISSIYSNFNGEILKTSLWDGMPVLLLAFSYKNGNTSERVGHAFIVDKIKRTRMVTRNYYVWVYDSRPVNVPALSHPDREEFIYSPPLETMIGMNWGWGPSSNSPNEWYSLTGDWHTGIYNWNLDRMMIHGFNVINISY